MKSYFKIIAVAAVLALLPLQYLLLSNVYKALENNLFVMIDDCFSAAVEEEAMIRYRSIDRQAVFHVKSTGGTINQNVLASINKQFEAYGVAPDMDTLRKIFAYNLTAKELYNLDYTIKTTKNDTSFYHSPEDFMNDPIRKNKQFTSLATHVVPITSDLTAGVVAIVRNPYKHVFSKMQALMALSVLIVLFVAYCLYLFAHTLKKVTFINNLRKDHTYAMIHDMKTPLSSIMIVAEDFRENTTIMEDPDAAVELNILEAECKHLNDICEKVITVAKLDNQKLQFVMEQINLPDFLHNLTSKYSNIKNTSSPQEDKILNYKDAVKEKQIKFNIDCGNVRSITADRLYLTEILGNLIDNSIKYSNNEVEISIRAGETLASVDYSNSFFHKLYPKLKMKEYVEIRVKDNGWGFSKDAKDKLFQKFERGENTVGISGHGIGLNYVYQLMKFFKGYVHIESKIGLFTEVVLGFPKNVQI